MGTPESRRAVAHVTRMITSRPLLARCFGVFAVAFILRAVTAVVLNSHFDPTIGNGFTAIARNLLAGNGFSMAPGAAVPTVTRAPFYPMFHAVVLDVFGPNLLWQRILEGALDALTAALVVVLAFLLAAAGLRPASAKGRESLRTGGTTNTDPSGTRCPDTLMFATAAGLIYAFQPFSIYYTVKLGAEAWFTFWLVVALVAFVRLVQRPGVATAAVTGLALGVLVLNRSVALGLIPILAVLAWMFTGDVGRRVRSVGAAVLLATVTAVVVPWLIRNHRVTGGDFVAVQTLTWWNFWFDSDFSSTGMGNSVATHYGPAGGHPYRLSAAADVAQEAQLFAEARDWALANPVQAGRKFVRNLAEFWYLTEGTGRSLVALVSNGLQLLISAAGGWLAWNAGARREVVLVVVVIAYFDLIYAPIFSILRFSLVVLPLLTLLEAVAVVWLWRRVRQRVTLCSWEDEA